MTTMLYRLGQVLCWAFSGFAALSLLFAAVAWFGNANDKGGWVVVLGVAAALLYGIGRACRFVLSGF